MQKNIHKACTTVCICNTYGTQTMHCWICTLCYKYLLCICCIPGTHMVFLPFLASSLYLSPLDRRKVVEFSTMILTFSHCVVITGAIFYIFEDIKSEPRCKYEWVFPKPPVAILWMSGDTFFVSIQCTLSEFNSEAGHFIYLFIY